MLYEHAGSIELDGARVCVAGLDADAPHVALLLHGNPSHLEHFDGILPALRRVGGVVAYDHPGFGRSTGFADGQVTLERSARIALGVLDSLGIAAVDVIGHSHGGLVAIALAALAPERVRSVVVMGTGAPPAPEGYRLLRAMPFLEKVLPVGTPGLAGTLTGVVTRHSFAPDAVPAGFIARQIDELRARPEILGAMVRLARDDPGAKAAAYAKRVRAPVLIVHGRGDTLVSIRHARALGAIFGDGARFVELPGGHMVHIAHPERVTPVLSEWLAATRG